ncbi:retrovirus-related pol polyprotein from transposon TNT 1-94 [Tanacetum coccineum]
MRGAKVFYGYQMFTKPKAAKVTKPAGDKAPKPTATQPPKPKPAPTQPSKAVSEKKRKLVKETPDEPSPTKRSKGGLVGKRLKPKSPLKLVDEPSDEGVPVEEPAHTDKEADLQRALELSLKEQAERTHEPARPMVLREPDSGKYQPLPETPTKKSPVDQFIFQRRPPMHIEPTGHADSPFLDAELPLTDNETESNEEVPVINDGDQDEGQAVPNPGEQDKGQAGPNPVILHLRQKPEQMDEEFTTTAYPKFSFIDQFFVKNPHKEESGKTNAETRGCINEEKIRKRAAPRTPFGSLPSPPPPPPPLAGASGALGISGTSRSSQLPPPPLPPSTGTSGSAHQQGSKAPSSSKPAASTHQSMAWTTSNTRFASQDYGNSRFISY